MSFLRKLNRMLKRVDSDIPRTHGAVVILKDQKAYDSYGGAASAGSWNARNVNTKTGNGDFVKGSFPGTNGSNTTFTLIPGDYYVSFSAPLFYSDYGTHRLYNNTKSTTETIGIAAYQGSSSDNNVYTDGEAFVSVRGQDNSFQIEYNMQSVHSTYDLGFKQNQDSGLPSIYTTVVIRKLA